MFNFNILLTITKKSLYNRLPTTILTVISISLSVFLILSVEKLRTAVEDGFTNSVSQVDLLVGARTGPINLILYTVFNVGSPSNNISWESYQEIKAMQEVSWTIPYSLGDSHRGYRVIATDDNFYKHYKYKGEMSIEFEKGNSVEDMYDVVIGAEVKEKLNYDIGSKIIIAHGVTKGEAIQKHDDKPFKVIGILKATGTPIDQSIYISLEGMSLVHGLQVAEETIIQSERSSNHKGQYQSNSLFSKKKEKLDNSDNKDFNNQKEGHDHDSELHNENEIESHHNHKLENGHDQNDEHDHELHEGGAITSFFIRTKNRVETLKLQRAINEYKKEPLLAIIPSVTLNELWRSLGHLEGVLSGISLIVLIVAMASMASKILITINERRREMTILRAIGATPSFTSFLLIIESGILSIAGIFIGFVIEIVIFKFLDEWLSHSYGIVVDESIITKKQLIYMFLIFIIGLIVSIIPAIKLRNLSIKDGLTIKV